MGLFERLRTLFVKTKDFCVNCKEYRPIRDVHFKTVIKTGRRSRQGTCTFCGCKTSKFVPG